MKTIRLDETHVALVSDRDYPALRKFIWHLRVHTHKLLYAYRYQRKAGGGYTQVRMHTHIINPPKGFSVDHRNRNGLDNRRCNLRLSTQQQQSMNTSVQSRPSKTSRFKGVTKIGLIHGRWQARNPWLARIRVDGNLRVIGYFSTQEDAALAYNRTAKRLFGKFAGLNKVAA